MIRIPTQDIINYFNDFFRSNNLEPKVWGYDYFMDSENRECIDLFVDEKSEKFNRALRVFKSRVCAYQRNRKQFKE